jgi:UDP-N-acetylmuramyl pentapeptide phosphotransferase/UDP-N-acetylglucosamine-1-phosphate transferase
LGGVALIFGLVTSALGYEHSFAAHGIAFYLALAVIWAMGLIDDLLSLSPWIKLTGQFGAALLFCQIGGWQVPVTASVPLNVAAACLFIATFVNAFNFLDGADGLAAGVAGMIALGYILLSERVGTPVGCVIAAALLGSCLGFLVFNFPPAKIFMGDSGSTTLGFIVAFLSLDFWRAKNGVGRELLLPLVFACLPLLDFFLAIFRRLRRGVSPFVGDRFHLYDLLFQRGWSARRVAIVCYAVAGLLLMLGFLGEREEWNGSFCFLLSLVLGCLLLAAVRLGSLGYGSSAGVPEKP